MLEDWRNANKKQQSQHIQSGNAAAVTLQTAEQGSGSKNVGQRWKKPMCGRLKCDVDASFFTSTNRLGIALCIPDEEGHFVRTKTMWLTRVCLLDVGEALGLYYPIWWIHYLRLQNVDFEVDSKRVADYFNRSKGDIKCVIYNIVCGVNFALEHS